MSLNIMGSFFGNYSGASIMPLKVLLYPFLDFIFFSIIIISFVIYYKFNTLVGYDSYFNKIKGICNLMVGVLSMLNIIFLGIIIEFIYIRCKYNIYMPIMTRMVWLFIGVTVLIMVGKAYGLLNEKIPKNKKRKYPLKRKKK